MTGTLFQLQSTVAFVLGIALFAMEVYALFEAVRYRAEAYPAAGKLTKIAWVAITAAAAAIGLIVMQSPLNLFGVIAVVASAVFLADVRPALRQVLGRGSSHRNRQGGRL